jgi:Na+/melibiose symporter-like transporter
MRRVDKHRAWAVAAAGMMGTLLAALAIQPGPDALVPMVAVMTSFGFFLGLSSIALPSLLADIVDYDLWRTRKDRAAIFFSFQALVTKLNQGVGGAVALAIPAGLGFASGDALTERAVLGLKLGFVAWPCLLLAPMLVLAWRYPLDRRAQGILRRRLDRVAARG